MSFDPPRELVLLIQRKLDDCFPDPREAAEARAILDAYGTQPWHRERERVQLAMLMSSGGRLDILRGIGAMANQDYRDVLVGAEYREQFRLPPGATPAELAAACRRDQARYEKWLNSSGKPATPSP